MFPDSNDTSQLVMATTVLVQATNPFLSKNSSSNDTLKINSAVVMLDLKDESGAGIPMGGWSLASLSLQQRLQLLVYFLFILFFV